MSRYNNPLNDIRIASPCAANWEEMIGDNRQRHCAECRLNVYNLSEMTQTEAKNFLINAEGRVCIKFYRRRDGTVLTKDCPVGWQAVKRRVSRAATAFFSLCFGAVSGFMAFQSVESDVSNLTNEIVVEIDESDTKTMPLSAVVGEYAPDKPKPIKNKTKRKREPMVMGRMEYIRRLEDEPVKLWIK